MENAFGERLRELRLKSNTTQKELSAKLKISSASIIAYEKGQKSPSLDVAVKLANYFGVTLDDLCGIAQSTNQLKTCGGLARIVIAMLFSGVFDVNVVAHTPDSSIADGVQDDVEIAQISIFRNRNITGTRVLNEFLIKFEKMVNLLGEGAITLEIFDRWMTSEVDALDGIPLEDITDAET